MMARIKCGRPESLFAEPDVAAARSEAIRAARIALHRLAVERLERVIRAADDDRADATLPTPAPARYGRALA